MDNKSVHVVFPSHFKEILYNTFKKAGKYSLTAFDTDITSYAHFILDEDTNEYCKTVLISTYYDSAETFMPILADTVELAIKIKLARQDLRMIFIFPTFVTEGHEYRVYISKLIMAGIYDLHFIQDFDYHHIESWLDNVQQIMDVKDYITSSDIPNLKQQIQVESHIIEIASNVEKEIQKQEENINVHVHSIEEAKKEEFFDFGNEVTANKPEELSEKKVESNKDSKNHSGKIKTIFNMTFPKNKKESSVKPLPENQIEQMETVITKGNGTKKIGVIGLTKSVGTSFITTNFASFLSNNDIEIGVYENPVSEQHRTYLADQFGFFDEENPNQSLPHAIANKREFDKKKAYNIKNVCYYPVNYLESPILEFPTHEMIRYVNTGGQSIKLMDLGCVTELELINTELLDKLSTFDTVVVVVNPLPIKVVPNIKILLDLQQALDTLNIHYVTVLNEYQGELPKGDLKIFDLHKSLEIPSVNHSSIIKAMHKKVTVYDYDSEIRNELIPYFTKLANHLDLSIKIKQHKGKNGFLKKVN